MEQLINDVEAAKLLGLGLTSLRRDRCIGSRGLNIPYLKPGGSIRYSPSQLQEWVMARAKNSPATPQEILSSSLLGRMNTDAF